MRAIAIVNSKGGVGKTTISTALAVRAAKDSTRVAMIDLDPQRSLIEWWQRRGHRTNPCIFDGSRETPQEALEKLRLDGWDYVFMDGPPAFLTVMDEMIQAADFVLIPVRASAPDLLATQDAVGLARAAGVPFVSVFNDVGPRDGLTKGARAALAAAGVAVADTEIIHRVSHISSMTVGKTAAEINNGRDAKARAEIDALWREVKSATEDAARWREAREHEHA